MTLRTGTSMRLVCSVYFFRISVLYDDDDDDNNNNKPRTNENSRSKDKIVNIAPHKSAPQQCTRTKRVNNKTKQTPTKIILIILLIK